MGIWAAIFGSSALSALISGVFTLIATKRKKNSGVAAGVKWCLYYQIKMQCRQSIADGKVTSEDLETLVQAHEIYHNELNGNGYLDSMMKKVKALPVVEL